MAEVQRTLLDGAHTKQVTLEVSKIAGPETAAKLGVPVGTVLQSELVVKDPENISQEEYDRLNELFSGEGSDN